MDPGRDTTLTGPSASLADLQDRLDTLWISYLRNLDEYTAAQIFLQDRLRSGYFSLSRANFNARPGMRYGRDYFHDRAVATRRVALIQDRAEEDNCRTKLEVIQHLPALDDNDHLHGSDDEETAAEEGLQQPSPPATPEPENKKGDESTDSADDQTEKTNEEDRDVTAGNAKSKLPLEADPLRWFGILVPQELRSAQASFSSAVDESLSQAVNSGRGMREVEAEIRKLRKEIRRAEKVEKS